jgi:RNA-splicing ligase RtcB
MTEGVECRKDADVIDETPAAYKSPDLVATRVSFTAPARSIVTRTVTLP